MDFIQSALQCKTFLACVAPEGVKKGLGCCLNKSVSHTGLDMIRSKFSQIIFITVNFIFHRFHYTEINSQMNSCCKFLHSVLYWCENNFAWATYTINTAAILFDSLWLCKQMIWGNDSAVTIITSITFHIGCSEDGEETVLWCCLENK